MPADAHPIDALEKQLLMEDLTRSPASSVLLKIASQMPLKWPFDKLVDALKADRVERISLMLDTCITEVRKHDSEIMGLFAAKTAEELREREQASRELLLDAALKAERTRAKDRIKRIALILANSVVESKRTDADEIEEMMRTAMDLSDRDVQFLGELIRIEGSMLQTRDYIPRYDAHMAWERGSWGERIDPELDSVFSKLESYGLVSRIAPPNNLNISADIQSRYVLLKKGLRFVSLIRESSVQAT